MVSIFIFGAGRSGTTWLAAIFNSHPDTLYVHEPDHIIRDNKIPYIPAGDVMLPSSEELRSFANRLANSRTLHAMQKRPFFHKSYRPAALEICRRALIMSGVSAAKIFGRFMDLRRLPIPDFCNKDAAIPVVKSVDSVGRLPLLARAMPEAKFIHIIRHPAAVYASVQRGVAQGKMTPKVLFDAQLNLPLARRHNITKAQRDQMDDIEQATWSWSILNDFVLEAYAPLPNVRRLLYEDLCDDPIGVAKSLFQFTGLAWNDQTEAFLSASLTTQSDGKSYHDVIRNPRIAANRWRSQLDISDIRRIEEIMSLSQSGRLYNGKETASP